MSGSDTKLLFSSSLVRCYARKIKFLILLTLLTNQPFTQMKDSPILLL